MKKVIMTSKEAVGTLVDLLIMRVPNLSAQELIKISRCRKIIEKDIEQNHKIKKERRPYGKAR